MNFLIVTLVLHFTWTSATNTSEVATNKTKRTVSPQVHTYGENRPVLLYPEANHAAPQTLPSIYAPATLKPVFDPELNKQVAAQQVLYEFQQTPTNAVSNVHVNQFYQPLGKDQASPAHYISGSESVATPVQHSSLVRHGQNYAQVQYHPVPQHVQTHEYIPGKYLYVNGKITYPTGQQNGFQQQQNGFQQQQVFQRPVNYLYTNPQAPTQKFIPPPLVVRPAGFRRFSPPVPSQMQQITKPIAPEVTEEQEEEEPPKEEEEEEVEEEDTEKESYEDDDDDRYFSKYSFDEEDEHDAEDDEDNERGSSKPVPKKQKKKPTKPNKYNKSDGYKYRESYSTSSKYEKPKNRKGGKNPKMHYTSVKYMKEGSGKPRVERIEGKQSQNVPVVHKQKLFKEKWYVTKSTDDSIL